MKKFATFALVVCLLVLAVAVVLGMTYPGIEQGVTNVLHDLGQRIKDFLDYLAEGVRVAFGPR